MSISTFAAAAALAALKANLDGGRLRLFAGPIPATPDEALDTVASHTRIASFTVDNDGDTGLTFAPPSGGGMVKNPTEVWEATIVFSGAQDTETTLTPTFWRFTMDGDNGLGVATGTRLQGTAGGPTTDLPCGAQTANGTNTLTVDTFIVAMDAG